MFYHLPSSFLADLIPIPLGLPAFPIVVATLSTWTILQFLGCNLVFVEHVDITSKVSLILKWIKCLIDCVGMWWCLKWRPCGIRLPFVFLFSFCCKSFTAILTLPHVLLQGRFEILSLSGSFMPSDSGGTRSRSGGMSVSLASPDGRVVGGGVAGLLVAASPVQVRPFSLLFLSFFPFFT